MNEVTTETETESEMDATIKEIEAKKQKIETSRAECRNMRQKLILELNAVDEQRKNLIEEKTQLELEKKKYDQDVAKHNRLEMQLKALKKQYKVEIDEFNRKNENFSTTKTVKDTFYKICSIERKMEAPVKPKISFETSSGNDLSSVMQEDDDAKFVAKLCTIIFTSDELLEKTTCRKKK